MVFSLIKQNYFYVNASGVDQGATIPTLWEWMDAFAANTELKLIILDLKIVDIDLADYLVSHIMTKAVALSAQSKIRIVSSDYSMAAALQTSLSRAGYDINIASRVFGGTAGAVHLGSNENFNAVEDAQTECYGLANVGQTVSSNGWRQYQNIVSKMVTKRDEAVFYQTFMGAYKKWFNEVYEQGDEACFSFCDLFFSQKSNVHYLVHALGRSRCFSQSIMVFRHIRHAIKT